MSTSLRRNSPSPLSPAEVQAWLAETTTDLVARRDEILQGYQRFLRACPDGIHDEDTQRRAADFASSRGIMGVFLKECGDSREREKKPFLDGGRAVDTFFKGLTEPVAKCQTDMRQHMARFAAELEAKRRAEAEAEAARLAAEAEAAALLVASEEDQQQADEAAQAAELAQQQAEASVAELSRTRGDLGTVVSLRTSWRADYENSDLMELVKAVARGMAPLSYLQFNESRIGYAIRSERVRIIPGVRIVEERKVL